MGVEWPVYVVFVEWGWQHRVWNPLWWVISWIAKYHVYAIIDIGEHSIVVNSDTTGVQITPIRANYVSKLLNQDDVAAYLDTKTSAVNYRYGWISFFSCVTLTKRLLGINKWWIITPMQLYKEILDGSDIRSS